MFTIDEQIVVAGLAPLVARLENATVGAETFDREIVETCGIAWSPDEGGNFGGYNILPPRCHFTRSVDAALSLMHPHHRLVELSQFTCLSKDGSPLWTASVEGLRVSIYDKSERRNFRAGFLATPALAVCIAALRARASPASR